MIADFYNIPIGNAKKLLPNFFMKKSMRFIMKTYNLQLKIRIEAKKYIRYYNSVKHNG